VGGKRISTEEGTHNNTTSAKRLTRHKMAQQPMRFRRQDDCGALRKDGGSGRMARLHLITACPLGELHLGEDGEKFTRTIPCHAMITSAAHFSTGAQSRVIL
jgi:hypothetical protein